MLLPKRHDLAKASACGVCSTGFDLKWFLISQEKVVAKEMELVAIKIA